MEDNHRHKGLRKKMVEHLAEMGIRDKNVLDAMSSVPRHFFIESALLEHAYENKALQIGKDQTISHPYTVAFQSELLSVTAGMKVLEIGTGSGYQCAVLCQLGAKVFSIERHLILHQKSAKLFEFLKKQDRKFNPHLVYGDGFKGIPAFAPFDRVIITCALPTFPEELLNQMKPGGILVMPYGEGVSQMTMIKEKENGEFEVSQHGEFSFVPMLEKRDAKSE
ncbi:MAG: protein-L-isoaspartate(D-aspartate) O-methyltransferase [Flavobacteriales bacterium]